MTMSYLGYLSVDDPVYGYFEHHIVPQLGLYLPDAAWKVFRFHFSMDVFLYEEKHHGIRLVGKFFKSADRDHARRTGETEFNNLLFLRSIGFSSAPHYVVRPFGFNPYISNLLVVEYLGGETLSGVIQSAMVEGRHNRLYRKLSALAHFFAALHNRTAGELTVNFDETCRSMEWYVRSLEERWGLYHDDARMFHHLKEVWRSRACMWEDRNVLVHGDATPSNLLFGRGRDVMAIDLERMRWADRVFDLGRLCGELKHFFFRHTGNPWAAEPFIGHFVWEYCCHFPDRDAAFRAITRRLP
ncbi:MAG: aminoglycoside phosphotransferase family protein, partial [Desulfobacteraceae bacterium]|nr:aminoglycoside phosphotransferase family protein [Desulfobacteraceae bacterium]